MSSRMMAGLGLVLSLVAAPACAALAVSGSVYLKGEPGSYISGGIGAPEVTWVHGREGIFFVSSNFDKGASVRFDDGRSWSFDFAAPTYNPVNNTNDGQFLKVGFYDGATRFPFNSPTKPGLSVFGNGRGNNQLSGWFDVREIAYATNGDVTRLAVDFRQYDENLTQTGPSLYGSLRINSSIPLTPIPVPSSAVLLLSALAVFWIRRGSGRR